MDTIKDIEQMGKRAKGRNEQSFPFHAIPEYQTWLIYVLRGLVRGLLVMEVKRHDNLP